jgi:uncharacterized membrane protein
LQRLSVPEVARLAAIAAIRTFLNYFSRARLGRDQNQARIGARQ